MWNGSHKNLSRDLECRALCGLTLALSFKEPLMIVASCLLCKLGVPAWGACISWTSSMRGFVQLNMLQ